MADRKRKLFGENEYSAVMKVPYSSCYFVSEGKGLTMNFISVVCVKVFLHKNYALVSVNGELFPLC